MDGHDIASRHGGAAFVAAICNTQVRMYVYSLYVVKNVHLFFAFLLY